MGVPVTTGPRVTTPKVLSSSTPSSTSSVRRLRAATASRASRSPTPSVVVPAPVWAPSSSPRSVRSTPTESWPLSPSCHPPRSPTPLSSPTTPPSLSISSSRTPMRLCALTTRPSTISASEPSSSPPPPTVTLTISSPPPSPVSPAASASPVSSTLTSARCQPYPLPPSPFLHDRLRSPHLPRIPAVPCPHRPRAHPADVRCQEHDVRFRPPSRTLPHRLRPLPWPHVHQGGR